MIKEVTANGGETTDHPEFLGITRPGKCRRPTAKANSSRPTKCLAAEASGHTDADKLPNVLLYMKKRFNDEENDQLKVADVCALGVRVLERSCGSYRQPAGSVFLET